MKTFSQPTQERIKMEERPTINFAPNIIIDNDIIVTISIILFFIFYILFYN